MAGVSPTQNSLKYLRKLGYTVQVVEYWNKWARRRIDLFHGIDLVAVKPGEILGVQTTSRDGMYERRCKLLKNSEISVWLLAGAKLQLHGWDKPDRLYRLKAEEITISDVEKDVKLSTVIKV